MPGPRSGPWIPCLGLPGTAIPAVLAASHGLGYERSWLPGTSGSEPQHKTTLLTAFIKRNKSSSKTDNFKCLNNNMAEN